MFWRKGAIVPSSFFINKSKSFKMEKLLKELQEQFYNEVDQQVHSGDYHPEFDMSYGVVDCTIFVDYYLDIEFRITNDEDSHYEIYSRAVFIKKVRVFFGEDESEMGRDNIVSSLEKTCKELKV